MDKFWDKLVGHSGSQYEDFEELTSQLFRVEFESDNKIYKRNGTPDAGVEAFVQLQTGEQWCCQAKWFYNFGAVQVNQIAKSFNTALEQYPKMTKYVVCIPLNLSDVRLGKNTARKKWDDLVNSCKLKAKDKGREIEIILWDSSHLTNLISNESNEGRKAYWFDEIDLTRHWFETKFKQAIAALGPRYSPELSVELELFHTLAAAGAGKDFHSYWQKLDIKRWKQTNRDVIRILEQKGKYEEAQNLEYLFKDSYDTWIGLNPSPLQADVFKGLEKGLLSLSIFIDKLYDLRFENEKLAPSERTTRQDFFEYCGAASSECGNRIQELTSLPTKAFEKKIIFLHGEAGKGKSHSLADLVKHRLNQGLPTILIPWQWFPNETQTPENAILKLLGFENKTWDNFLGALNSRGEQYSDRSLIILDAINEGSGPRLWQAHLNRFLQTFEPYPFVGLLISCRNGIFFNEIRHELEGKVVLVEHPGFDGVYYQAINKYFDHYGIEEPTIPLLNPEFANPLFLKLFCKMLKDQGKTTVPKGINSISEIFESLIKHCNTAVSRMLGTRVEDKVTQKTLKLLI